MSMRDCHAESSVDQPTGQYIVDDRQLLTLHVELEADWLTEWVSESASLTSRHKTAYLAQIEHEYFQTINCIHS